MSNTDTLQQKAPMIAVSGGKGGVGKTVIAVNLALLAARAGYRTLLVDLDPGLGNVDVHLRIARETDVAKLTPHGWREHFQDEVEKQRQAPMAAFRGS